MTESKSYLYTQHSEFRSCTIGPELLLGELAADVRGTTPILLGGSVLWEDEFLSSEENMSRSITNLEHYHFRYEMFRRPGVSTHIFLVPRC